MCIKVKSELKKSRNPSELGIRLENETGELVTILGDGYNLVRFHEFEINVQGSKKKEPLEWYLHENDFHDA